MGDDIIIGVDLAKNVFQFHGERSSRCQTFGCVIELRFAPGRGRPLVFDATENDDAVDLCGSRSQRKFRFQRSEQDLTNGKYSNHHKRYQRYASTPARQVLMYETPCDQ